MSLSAHVRSVNHLFDEGAHISSHLFDEEIISSYILIK